MGSLVGLGLQASWMAEVLRALQAARLAARLVARLVARSVARSVVFLGESAVAVASGELQV